MYTVNTLKNSQWVNTSEWSDEDSAMASAARLEGYGIEASVTDSAGKIIH